MAITVLAASVSSRASLAHAGSAAARSDADGPVRLLHPTELSTQDIEAWDALGDAPDPHRDANIFARPWAVRAGLRHCAPADVLLAFVTAPDGLLIGVAPLAIAARLGRFPLSHWQLWSHPNSFCAPILIRPGHETAFWATLLGGLPTSPGVSAFAVSGWPLDSQSYAGLAGHAADTGAPIAIVERHARALASADTPFDRYWDTYVRAKKRKELRRQAARLAELGSVTLSDLQPRDDVDVWIDEFLALERVGWKGSAGSALAAAPGTEAFFRDIITAAHARASLAFLALRLDGRAVAMLAILFDGEAAFSFKTAYDEGLARFSPGVQIQQHALAVLAARNVRWADSCAAAEHPMIDSLWAQRRTIATVVTPLPGRRNHLRFRAYRAALALWRALKHHRKRSGEPA